VDEAEFFFVKETVSMAVYFYLADGLVRNRNIP